MCKKAIVMMGLCAGLFPLTTMSGCLFAKENCETGDYCVGDELWTSEGPGEWSGCIDDRKMNCAAFGQECRELQNASFRYADCYYPDIQCDSGVLAVCDGDFLYQCDDLGDGANVRKSCADSGQICREFTDGTEKNAGCFYEDIACPETGGETIPNTVCDDDFAYTCNTELGLAEKRMDCREYGRVCADVPNWGAVCTTTCDEEGRNRCSEEEIMTAHCIDGLWIPGQDCGAGRRCLEVELNETVEALCIEPQCDETQSPNESYCNGNYWVFVCGERREELLCENGCIEVPYRDDKVFVSCNR